MGKSEFGELKEIAKKLEEKNSWVRKATKELMDRWAEESECGEDMRSTTYVSISDEEDEEDDFEYCLKSGSCEIRTGKHYQRRTDVSGHCHFSNIDATTMEELRSFLRVFPKMAEEIETEMKNKLNIEFDFLK